MLHTYFPVLLLLGFVIANAVLMLGLSHLTLRPRPSAVKQAPYNPECHHWATPTSVSR